MFLVCRLEKMFEVLADEANVNGFYYNMHRLNDKSDMPKVEAAVKKLRERGFQASKTHFDTICIRTNASVKELKAIINE